MKRYIFIAILIALSMNVTAKHVDLGTAKSVAATFWEKNVLKGNSPKLGIEFRDITEQTEFSNIYILNTNGGFVIVSADDMAKPILGYSSQGSFDPENIPVNAKNWLRNYCDEIQYAIDHNIEAGEATLEAWNNLRNGTGLSPKSTRTVSQLLSTTWNQRPYYNNLCPYDEEEGELAEETDDFQFRLVKPLYKDEKSIAQSINLVNKSGLGRISLQQNLRKTIQNIIENYDTNKEQ